MDLSAAVEPAERRALVLLALHDQYPFPFAEQKVLARLGRLYAGDPKSWARDLAILTEGGWIERKSDTVQGVTYHALRLTLDGVSLVEGRVVHPAVSFPQAEE